MLPPLTNAHLCEDTSAEPSITHDDNCVLLCYYVTLLPQVSYNADSIFITYKSLCPSNATANGIGLLALPKHAAYMGMVNFFYAIYTSAELQAATAAAAGGGAAAAAAEGPCSQLQPVRPQGPADVIAGTAYFVCEVRLQTCY
jgi:hypothetical protein